MYNVEGVCIISHTFSHFFNANKVQIKFGKLLSLIVCVHARCVCDYVYINTYTFLNVRE